LRSGRSSGDFRQERGAQEISGRREEFRRFQAGERRSGDFRQERRDQELCALRGDTHCNRSG
jgi:hypothetical protein